MVRIAHFSDTHVLSLKGVGPSRFLNKRWTGAVNLALNRSKHYRVEIFEQLLQAVKESRCDHAICTGDLVNLALEPEFERVAELLENTFGQDQLTLVPGNHDYYVKEAVSDGLFERYFGRWLSDDLALGLAGHYPVSRIVDEVVVVGVNSAIPTGVFMARGRVGDQQLTDLDGALNHEACDARFKLLMIHHPLLPEPNRRLDVTRRLEDADEVITRLVSAGESAPDLVVHGHNHEFKRMVVPGSQIPLIQVASASRSGERHRAEFNIYNIEDGVLCSIERHIHQPESGEFVRCDELGTPIDPLS